MLHWSPCILSCQISVLLAIWVKSKCSLNYTIMASQLSIVNWHVIDNLEVIGSPPGRGYQQRMDGSFLFSQLFKSQFLNSEKNQGGTA